MKKIINIKTLSIAAIIWGILFFIYKMFYPISLFDLIGSNLFLLSIEEKEYYELLLTNAYPILNIIFVIILALIIATLIYISLKNKNKPVISGLLLLILGFVLTFVDIPLLNIINITATSWIPVIIGGIYLLMYYVEED